MENIKTKFPSIWNSKCRDEINIKLYNKTPDTQIANWLEKNAECKEDCISASTIRRYRIYVNERGGFQQLINPKELPHDDITFTELTQEAINQLYNRLSDLEGGNFVQACASILKIAQPMNINLNSNINADVGIVTNETEEERLNRYANYFERINSKATSISSNNNSR